MATGVNSTKSPARPSHEAIESETSATDVESSDQKHLDHIAMEAAKRSGTRLANSAEESPGGKLFSK